MLYPISITLHVYLCICNISSSQGHIDQIKNQFYLDFASQVNCDSLTRDNLSARICANLSFQHIDSLLVNEYNILLSKYNTINTLLADKFVQSQEIWRELRHWDCNIESSEFGEASLASISYLDCPKEKTLLRVSEL